MEVFSSLCVCVLSLSLSVTHVFLPISLPVTFVVIPIHLQAMTEPKIGSFEFPRHCEKPKSCCMAFFAFSVTGDLQLGISSSSDDHS